MKKNQSPKKRTPAKTNKQIATEKTLRLAAKKAADECDARVKKIERADAEHADGDSQPTMARGIPQTGNDGQQKPAKEPRPSLVSAAADVLKESREPMTAKAIVSAAASTGRWTPGDGKTPEATLHAAMCREIKGAGEKSRFKKVGRGLFAAA